MVVDGAEGSPLPPLSFPPTPCLPPPFFERRGLCARKICFFFPPFFSLSVPHFPPPSYPVHQMNKLPKGCCTKSLQLNKKFNACLCFYIIIVFYGLLCADILNCTRLLCIFSFHHTTKNDNLRYFIFFCDEGEITKHFFRLFFHFFFCICPKLQKTKVLIMSG